MVRDAEQFATTDKARKDAIEAKNELETAIYSAEKSFAEYKVRRAGLGWAWGGGCGAGLGFRGDRHLLRRKELRRRQGALLSGGGNGH